MPPALLHHALPLRHLGAGEQTQWALRLAAIVADVSLGTIPTPVSCFKLDQSPLPRNGDYTQTRTSWEHCNRLELFFIAFSHSRRIADEVWRKTVQADAGTCHSTVLQPPTMQRFGIFNKRYKLHR